MQLFGISLWRQATRTAASRHGGPDSMSTRMLRRPASGREGREGQEQAPAEGLLVPRGSRREVGRTPAAGAGPWHPRGSPLHPTPAGHGPMQASPPSIPSILTPQAGLTPSLAHPSHPSYPRLTPPAQPRLTSSGERQPPSGGVARWPPPAGLPLSSDPFPATPPGPAPEGGVGHLVTPATVTRQVHMGLLQCAVPARLAGTGPWALSGAGGGEAGAGCIASCAPRVV